MVIAEVANKTIRESQVCMISYINMEGYPITRAMMLPRKIEPHGVFLFSTNTISNKVTNFKRDAKASVYFFDKEKFIGISLIGRMSIVDDIEVKHSVWLDGDEMFYKSGKDGGDYVAMKFVAESGNIYMNLQSQEFKPEILT